MKELETEGKINFIDKNDVLVGFDTNQGCCENFGWFYSLEPPNLIEEKSVIPENLESYIFDTNYFLEAGEESDVDQGGMVTFKLANEQNILYLSLYNSQNVYYSHGFEMSVSGKTLNEGYL